MAALLLLFVCIVLGALVARFARPPQGLVHSINWWVINVALPALVLELIPRLHVDAHLWFLVATMWITFFGAWVLLAALGAWLGWSRERIGALILVCGLGNTSFMGYPMIQALHGQSGLSLAVVSDQLGCFPLLASAGIVVASLYGGRRPQARVIARRMLTFPAFIALVVGIIVGALGGWPAFMDGVLAPIGHTLTPLALFSVGLQLKLRAPRGAALPATVGLGWKLALAPLLGWGLGMAAGVSGLMLSVGVLQAAMAPMISGAILADEYGLEPPLANAVLGAGILLSLLTVPGLDRLLGG